MSHVHNSSSSASAPLLLPVHTIRCCHNQTLSQSDTTSQVLRPCPHPVSCAAQCTLTAMSAAWSNTPEEWLPPSSRHTRWPKAHSSTQQHNQLLNSLHHSAGCQPTLCVVSTHSRKLVGGRVVPTTHTLLWPLVCRCVCAPLARVPSAQHWQQGAQIIICVYATATMPTSQCV